MLNTTVGAPPALIATQRRPLSRPIIIPKVMSSRLWLPRPPPPFSRRAFQLVRITREECHGAVEHLNANAWHGLPTCNYLTTNGYPVALWRFLRCVANIRELRSNFINLPLFREDGDVLCVETPRGSRAKFAYDPKLETFVLSKLLLTGLSYSHDWGSVPQAAISELTTIFLRGDVKSQHARSGRAIVRPGAR